MTSLLIIYINTNNAIEVNIPPITELVSESVLSLRKKSNDLRLINLIIYSIILIDKMNITVNDLSQD